MSNNITTAMEGQRIPSVTWPTRENDSWVNVSSDELFSGKTVVLFSLPGAFTPTCSSTHLPRYNELAKAFQDQGVDEIVCISVNDTFVMNAWAKDQESDNVRLIADGNGQFTDGMGMLVDKQDLGFGKRSWRYSMLVRDGVVEKMFVEPQKPGDPFEVSDADTMLNYINPEAEAPASISVFTKPGCGFCARAKQALTDRGMPFEEILLGRDANMTSLRAVTGRETVPQVFINGQHVGGSEELDAWLEDQA
ncbi:MAG: glutathione peroxidase [Oceanospirillaceae bacterium]|nr:glutathione peroxidase [Oceanospirillaceae bacterium]|tara:strand:- start:446 stop:1195 length:750 start_codon:yes stop_codon:yes gene_type:complete